MSICCRILLCASIAAGTLGLGPCSGQTVRTKQVLSEGWHVKQLESDKPDIQALMREATSPDKTWLSARMPAQVHDVLLEHGQIVDPMRSENAAKYAWVAQKDWVYATRFASPTKRDGPVFLHFDGLDTLATVYLNGSQIGSFNNMHRRYRVDIRPQLAAAGTQNTLLIVFGSAVRFVKEVKLPPSHEGNVTRNRYLRKIFDDSPYLGARPGWTKVGVFKDVWLDMPGPAWIEDVWVRTELASNFKRATLRIRAESSGSPQRILWRLVDPSGAEAASGAVPAAAGPNDFTIDVADPKLWWPRTHGIPHLYKLSIALGNWERPVDREDVNVGIREIRPILSDKATGEPRFGFEVNGRPIYWQGACWAPLELMTICWNSERAKRTLDLAEHARMNILRVWAEGPEPPKEFYDECDRRGIAVWQDFSFNGGMYPTDAPGFKENVREELEGVVRRLRNHPSLLLWAGGNENHMFIDWAGKQFTIGRDLFDEIMPDVIARLDPTRYFHPNSPYGGPVPNAASAGDFHDYTTIHFEPEASVPTWISEVTRASPPNIGSMRKFLTEEELWPKGWNAVVREPGVPAWPPAWTYHSTGIASWDRIGKIEEYVDPAGPADLIRNLGTAHGEYLRDRLERQRRGVPDGAPEGPRRNWGSTIWRLNDSWPMIYSSLIDYYLEPKIPYYFTRRANDPILVSLERTADRICVWIVNDSPEPVGGSLVVKRVDFNGKVLGEMDAYVQILPAQSKRLLDLTGFGFITLRDEFLQATFAGRESTFLLIGEKYLHLPKASLKATRVGDAIEISTDAFARQVTLEAAGVTGATGVIGAVFEDNYFDMAPGGKRMIKLVYPAGAWEVTVHALNGAPVKLTL